MRWTEQVIFAHKNSLAQRPADRRPRLIALWEQYRNDGSSDPVVETAVELATQGNVNEVELGFYVLMDLALKDSSLCSNLSKLAHHKSASVRRDLAFYLSWELPSDITGSVFTALLRDKAASVRLKAIDTIGLRNRKGMMTELRALRERETNEKVIASLDCWLPLLENGYRVDHEQQPGCFTVTAFSRYGVASKMVEASSPDDPRILAVVEELRKHPG